MRVLVTGARGFIGSNLCAYLVERRDVELRTFARGGSDVALREVVQGIDFVFHLAGINRPDDPEEFVSGNVGSTQSLCGALRALDCPPPVLYASSVQAERDNPYGISKLKAEQELARYHGNTGAYVYVFRLPNVFGKWCRPNYNSVVATFCHNIARGLEIQISDPAVQLSLVYIDDVVRSFAEVMDRASALTDVTPIYHTTLGNLAQQIRAFRASRASLVTEDVGTGLVRALHSTYLSYLPPEQFSYTVPQYRDHRGVFVEMLKTQTSGQFSYFTAYPGVTRGGHYHHSKTEKFLVIRGKARFGFRHILTHEKFDVHVSGEEARIVETVPGWTHDITNVGDEEMVVMLWANEIFDRALPDTYTQKV